MTGGADREGHIHPANVVSKCRQRAAPHALFAAKSEPRSCPCRFMQGVTLGGRHLMKRCRRPSGCLLALRRRRRSNRKVETGRARKGLWQRDVSPLSARDRLSESLSLPYVAPHLSQAQSRRPDCPQQILRHRAAGRPIARMIKDSGSGLSCAMAMATGLSEMILTLARDPKFTADQDVRARGLFEASADFAHAVRAWESLIFQNIWRKLASARIGCEPMSPWPTEPDKRRARVACRCGS